MRIGIIAEGKGDLAVIENVIKGITGFDSSNFFHLRPSDDLDETDLGRGDPTRSTWSLVKKECVEKKAIERFLKLEDNKYIVIHLDTDRAQDYEIEIPERNDIFCENLREKVIIKIKEWLGNEYLEKMLFAIAIEEIDAWLLTIHGNLKDTSLSPNPKKALSFSLAKKRVDTTSNYYNFLSLSKPFSKDKEVKKGKFLELNCSLRLFHEEVQKMWAKENLLIN